VSPPGGDKAFAESAVLLGGQLGLQDISQPIQSLMQTNKLTDDAADQQASQNHKDVFRRKAHLQSDDQGDEPHAPHHHLADAIRKT
jgi:hypothetical protein